MLMELLEHRVYQDPPDHQEHQGHPELVEHLDQVVHPDLVVLQVAQDQVVLLDPQEHLDQVALPV